jgi:hypothetical protein
MSLPAPVTSTSHRPWRAGPTHAHPGIVRQLWCAGRLKESLPLFVTWGRHNRVGKKHDPCKYTRFKTDSTHKFPEA